MGIFRVQRSKARPANERWEKYGRLQSALVESLNKIGKPFFTRLAGMVEQCHRRFDGRRCRPHGHQWAVTRFSCKCRLCPFEMRARAMAAVHKFGSVLESLKDPKYLVLSMQNCQIGELRGGIDELFKAFRRLRHSALWSKVEGGIAVLEVTFNEKCRTWHPHLNVVFEGPYAPKPELNAVWLRSTQGRGCMTWIRRANRGTVFELVKYIVKPSEFLHIPEAVENFLRGTRGKRFIRTYGSLYGVKLEDELERECEEQGREVCPDCGSRDVEDLGISLRRVDVYFDDAGKLRFCVPDSGLVGSSGVPSYDG